MVHNLCNASLIRFLQNTLIILWYWGVIEIWDTSVWWRADLHENWRFSVWEDGAVSVSQVLKIGLKGVVRWRSWFAQTKGRGQFDTGGGSIQSINHQNTGKIQMIKSSFYTDKTNEITREIYLFKLKSARKFCCYLQLSTEN